MQQIEGKSFADIFSTSKDGLIDKTRDYVLIGKERHDVGRPDDTGYPIRGIVSRGFLYLVNFMPGRWPAGNPETGYLNCDASPTKSWILTLNRSGESRQYWNQSFGFRESEELYQIGKDPDCIKNLASDNAYNAMHKELHEKLYSELEKQGDPRIKGSGDIFDRYIYADEKTRDFYNRYMSGELSRKSASWADSSDFEKALIRK
jgi:hypothetical protein